MKKLIVLAVLVVAVLAGAWVGFRYAPLVSPPPVVESSPTEVVEPTPTEKIEEPTPTPVPPTPTPEPTATPTPEPTPTPVPEYVGLPPAEVEQLREQCLQENPDSLCLPLPVDPTQPGVEVFILQVRGKNSGNVYGILGIKAPAGTIFYAPFGGVYKLSFRCDPDCDQSSGWPTLEDESLDLQLNYFLVESSMLTAADFLDPSIFERLINDWRGIPLSLGDIHFVLKTDDLTESLGAGLVLVSDPGVQAFILFWVWGEDGFLSFDEDDLLKDDQGRIVFVQP